MSKINKFGQENAGKTEMIQLFAESLDKNCKNAEDVANVIKCIDEFTVFMDKQKQRKHDFILNIQAIKEVMSESSANSEMLDDLNCVSDEFITAMMLADRYKKENDMLCEIVNDPILFN